MNPGRFDASKGGDVRTPLIGTEAGERELHANTAESRVAGQCIAAERQGHVAEEGVGGVSEVHGRSAAGPGATEIRIEVRISAGGLDVQSACGRSTRGQGKRDGASVRDMIEGLAIFGCNERGCNVAPDCWIGVVRVFAAGDDESYERKGVSGSSRVSQVGHIHEISPAGVILPDARRGVDSGCEIYSAFWRVEYIFAIAPSGF